MRIIQGAHTQWILYGELPRGAREQPVRLCLRVWGSPNVAFACVCVTRCPQEPFIMGLK